MELRRRLADALAAWHPSAYHLTSLHCDPAVSREFEFLKSENSKLGQANSQLRNSVAALQFKPADDVRAQQCCALTMFTQLSTTACWQVMIHSFHVYETLLLSESFRIIFGFSGFWLLDSSHDMATRFRCAHMNGALVTDLLPSTTIICTDAMPACFQCALCHQVVNRQLRYCFLPQQRPTSHHHPMPFKHFF